MKNPERFPSPGRKNPEICGSLSLGGKTRSGSHHLGVKTRRFHYLIPLFASPIWFHYLVPLFGSTIWFHYLVPLFGSTKSLDVTFLNLRQKRNQANWHREQMTTNKILNKKKRQFTNPFSSVNSVQFCREYKSFKNDEADTAHGNPGIRESGKIEQFAWIP